LVQKEEVEKKMNNYLSKLGFSSALILWCMRIRLKRKIEDGVGPEGRS
jgi:hypothetical protein